MGSIPGRVKPKTLKLEQILPCLGLSIKRIELGLVGLDNVTGWGIRVRVVCGARYYPQYLSQSNTITLWLKNCRKWLKTPNHSLTYSYAGHFSRKVNFDAKYDIFNMPIITNESKFATPIQCTIQWFCVLLTIFWCLTTIMDIIVYTLSKFSKSYIF